MAGPIAPSPLAEQAHRGGEAKYSGVDEVESSGAVPLMKELRCLLAIFVLSSVVFEMKFTSACLLAATALATETPMIRDYLQIGGRYVENAAGEHVFQDQMYVEHLAPVNGTSQQYPLILIHGTAQSATVSASDPQPQQLVA